LLDLTSNDDEHPKINLYFIEVASMNTDREVQVVPKVFRAAPVTSLLDPLPKVPLAPNGPPSL